MQGTVFLRYCCVHCKKVISLFIIYSLAVYILVMLYSYAMTGCKNRLSCNS